MGALHPAGRGGQPQLAGVLPQPGSGAGGPAERAHAPHTAALGPGLPRPRLRVARGAPARAGDDRAGSGTELRGLVADPRDRERQTQHDRRQRVAPRRALDRLVLAGLVVVLACALAAWRVRSPELDRRLSTGLALLLLALVAVGMGGKYLHGSPSVTVGECRAAARDARRARRRRRPPARRPLRRAAAAGHRRDRTVGRADAAAGAHARLCARRAAAVPGAERSPRHCSAARSASRCSGCGCSTACRYETRRAAARARAAARRMRPTAPSRASQRAGGAPSAKQRRADGIPRNALAEVRPIGRGPRFEPPVRGPRARRLHRAARHRLEAHIEVFGADRVVLLPAGIGTQAAAGHERRPAHARSLLRCSGHARSHRHRLLPSRPAADARRPLQGLGPGAQRHADRLIQRQRVRVYVNGRAHGRVAARGTAHAARGDRARGRRRGSRRIRVSASRAPAAVLPEPRVGPMDTLTM